MIMEFAGFKYRPFNTPEKRREIYRFAKELSTYLHDSQIPNLIFIDSAPRPGWVGVDEYWKQTYPGEKRPDIYFINPSAFASLEKIMKENYLTEDDVLKDQQILAALGSSPILEELRDGELLNHAQFEQTYTKLKEQKDKPIALFDNCIHTGYTIKPVLNYFAKANYKDIRIVVADGDDTEPGAPVVDKDLRVYRMASSCYPFGTNASGVTKGDNIHSDFDDYADRGVVAATREEIRKIIREQGK